jgi:hypothetical protein
MICGICNGNGHRGGIFCSTCGGDGEFFCPTCEGEGEQEVDVEIRSDTFGNIYWVDQENEDVYTPSVDIGLPVEHDFETVTIWTFLLGE